MEHLKLFHLRVTSRYYVRDPSAEFVLKSQDGKGGFNEVHKDEAGH